MKSNAVILGGYINGYAIINELYAEGVEDIILVTYTKKLAYYSNKISGKYLVQMDAGSLLKVLKIISNESRQLVLYPTDDWFVEKLAAIYEEIKSFCFIPINHKNVIELSNKNEQYRHCQALGIPYPKSVEVESENDIENIKSLALPLIVKPNVRKDLSNSIFRSKRLNDTQAVDSFKEELLSLITAGNSFVVSEIIPGTSSGNIYAYCAYISNEGKILNEWGGRKLSQYPDDYGVFSSASNEVPDVVIEQGRKLVLGMNCYGFCEPEFKFDERDGKYKLMEVNLRPMMWNEVGFRSGVSLHYTQWCYANSLAVPEYCQDTKKLITLIYFKHEFINFLLRKQYRQTFKSIMAMPNRYWSGCYKGDLRPFIFNTKAALKELAKRVLKR
ncbi:carboxylate--amine ligase [Parapedobacter sp.]